MAETTGDNRIEKARGFQQKHSLTYPILLAPDDGVMKFMKAYDTKALPSNVAIDQQDKVVGVIERFDEAALTAVIQKVTRR